MRIKVYKDRYFSDFFRIFAFVMDRMPRLMGIVNLTDDSFYPPSRLLGADGSFDRARFLARCRQMASEGASWLDLGACSTRPGSVPVSEEIEWSRLSPALDALAAEAPELLPLLSVDTFRGGIVRRVFDAVGPFLVNDISRGQLDSSLLPTVADLGLPYVAMHMRGTPSTMDTLCDYDGDVVGAVHRYFEDFTREAGRLGIREWILDPGLGFAKTPAQCLELLEHLDTFADFGRPILVGLSRKRLVRAVGGDSMDAAMARLHRLAVARGASILRVHDVAAARACL